MTWLLDQGSTVNLEFSYFVETVEDLTDNFASPRFDLEELETRNKLLVDYVQDDEKLYSI